MDIATFLTLVEEGDMAAVAVAPGMIEARDRLLVLKSAEDPLVRAVALRCLLAQRDPEAAPALLDALLDDDAYVRSLAYLALEPEAGPAMAPALLERYDRCPLPAARRSLALLLGATRAPALAPELRARWERESDPGAGEGCLLALAQLGDEEARRGYALALGESSGEERRRLLAFAGKVREPWLLPALFPLLESLEPLVYAGVHGAPGPMSLRTADLVVDLVVSIARLAPSFRVDGASVYPAEQIAEIRELLRARGVRSAR